MEKDILIIKKEAFGYEDYVKPLKVSTELHRQVKELAEETNQPLSKVSCLLVEFALKYVKIEE